MLLFFIFAFYLLSFILYSIYIKKFNFRTLKRRLLITSQSKPNPEEPKKKKQKFEEKKIEKLVLFKHGNTYKIKNSVYNTIKNSSNKEPQFKIPTTISSQNNIRVKKQNNNDSHQSKNDFSHKQTFENSPSKNSMFSIKDKIKAKIICKNNIGVKYLDFNKYKIQIESKKSNNNASNKHNKINSQCNKKTENMLEVPAKSKSKPNSSNNHILNNSFNEKSFPTNKNEKSAEISSQYNIKTKIQDIARKNKLSNNKNVKSLPDKNPCLSNEIKTCVKILSLSNDEEKKFIKIKSNIEHEIQQSSNSNTTFINKIRVRNIYEMLNENMVEKYSDLFNIKINVSHKIQFYALNDSPLINVRLAKIKPSFRNFHRLREKYFNKFVQDSIVIIDNIIVIKALTNIHSISRIRQVSNKQRNEQYEVQNIGLELNLHLDYMKIIETILTKNCVGVISTFEDSDYEHGLLMFILCLFVGLKTFKPLEKSYVLLNKFEQLQWETVKQDFNHRKLLLTLKSNTFHLCYNELSKLIDEDYKKNPSNLTKHWKLFTTPSFNINHFHSVIDAITSASDTTKIIRLIEEASNNLRLNSKVNNLQSPSISTNTAY